MKNRLQQARTILKNHGIRALISKVLVFTARRIFRDVLDLVPNSQLVVGPELLYSKFHYSLALETGDGIVPARRPINNGDFAFEVPFPSHVTDGRWLPDEKIAAIVHIYYTELTSEILEYLNNIPCRFDLFVSTDTQEKRTLIIDALSSFKRGNIDVRVFPNRGRDIAPKIVGFSDVYEKYPYFVYVHSKKSPHGGQPLETWRQYLLDNILGSEDIVKAILFLLQSNNIGIVFPQHFFPIRGILNWGYDFEHAKRLLDRVGVCLSKMNILEFPSGSMFWGRSAALRMLLDLHLSFDDFEEENGQIDGTLAHAIERSFLFFAEQAGVTWAKISRRDKYPLPETLIPVRDADDLTRLLPMVHRGLIDSHPNCITAVEHSIGEMVSLATHPSGAVRPRLTLLLNTINPRQSFGGVGTALNLFDSLRGEIGDGFDYRIVSCDAPVETEALARYPSFSVVGLGPIDNDDQLVIVNAANRSDEPMPIRRKDFCIATAWWTVWHARRAAETQRRFFGCSNPIIYLIQDFEPNFYGWSARWSLAEATYHQGDETIAIINSAELYSFMKSRYRFMKSYCLPYEIHPELRPKSGDLIPRARRREILFYGRPSVPRNCFEIAVDGIYLWQQRNPVEASRWSIISVGESYPQSWASHVNNLKVFGKVSLNDYHNLLRNSAIGISLMISPHPSYPPLEMASHGMWTITNDYDEKDLSTGCQNIISIRQVTSQAVADAITRSVARAEQCGLIAEPMRPVAAGFSDSASVLDIRSLAADLKHRAQIDN